MSTLARVRLWGTEVGAVSLEDGQEVAAFEYHPQFLGSGIELSPLKMPLSPQVYRFPGLAREAFHGLPGLLADALPDRFGNALIDAWLATQGRTPESFNAVERLCYTGIRGMGALEFIPSLGPNAQVSARLRLDALTALASEILSHRDHFNGSFAADRAGALRDILRVGTSAGGARAKAVIAWNEATGEVRSGQVQAGEGFGYWLLKFDGVSGNRDRELADPAGYGAVEFAYALMAQAAGIEMSECRLMEEGGRRHFITRRFDRLPNGDKLHMQSLAALAHLDFNDPRANAYEQAFLTIRQLGLGPEALEAQFRRMAFNIVARNQDDHVKNIAFLMDRRGAWRLAPAFDLTWSFNPQGAWTAQHQMSMNGRRDGFGIEDFRTCARTAGLKRGRAEAILGEVIEAVRRWPDFAERARVEPRWRGTIQDTLRLDLPAA